VTGTVSLEAGAQGHQHEPHRASFYDHKDGVFTLEWLGRILRAYLRRIRSKDARLKIEFSYPLLQRSLRSGLEGWQYYQPPTRRADPHRPATRRFPPFDFVYSSACPCSAELAEHARDRRRVYSIPHSQRSKARVTVEIRRRAEAGARGPAGALRQCAPDRDSGDGKAGRRTGVRGTERRLHQFVEDAARLLYRELNRDPRIRDFQVACTHLESLHSHDAVSVICKGVKGGFAADFIDFDQLVC